MAFESAQPEQGKVDFRVYIGMLFFRWQLIALFFLYCLLGAVLYIQIAPKEYLTSCGIMSYRDPNSMLGRANPYASYGAQRYLLQSDKLRGRAVTRLAEKWSKRMGGQQKMYLPVSVGIGGSTLNINVRSGYPLYAEDFLRTLVDEHKTEWQNVQMESVAGTVRLLEQELTTIEEKIKGAEDDLIEYERLHDVTRVSLRGSSESGYLASLIGRQRALTTQLMMMEHHFPQLKDANEMVIAEVARMTRDIGTIGETPTQSDAEPTDDAADESATPSGSAGSQVQSSEDSEFRKKVKGWTDLRLELARLQVREKEMLQNLKPEHPEVQAIRNRIAGIQGQLQVAAQVEMANLNDRYNALKIELAAIEAAEYKWQAKNMFAAQRLGELGRVAAVLRRFEANYATLFARLHDTKISEELKVEHFSVVTPVRSGGTPVWPDPMKILLMAVVAGLGSGLGVAVVAHVLDNKVQSIRDVEKELGVSYLGGVPFWVHSGLERAIRPIVTEEHSTGAVEAYRALRTTIISALGKMNEKIFFVTSADSREGKTLTALNITIMLAQMNKKVLLVDMDLRRGRLHRSLSLEKEPGVSNVLKDGLALRDVIRQTKIDNLYLAPTGSSIEDSAELLQSSDLMNMLVELQNEYDYVCIDTSPVLRVSDTVIMTTQGIGVVVYVARVNHTPKPLIRYSLDMLRDAKVLGLIMNSIELHKVSSLYYSYQYPNYAYYSNAYAYGYDYHYSDDHKGGAKKRRHPHEPTHSRGNPLTRWFRRNLLPME